MYCYPDQILYYLQFKFENLFNIFVQKKKIEQPSAANLNTKHLV